MQVSRAHSPSSQVTFGRSGEPELNRMMRQVRAEKQRNLSKPAQKGFSNFLKRAVDRLTLWGTHLVTPVAGMERFARDFLKKTY
jgi:hypothetical protein